MDFFSIKICLLNHRKFDITQEGILEKSKYRATRLKENVFVKLGEFDK